MSDLSSTYRAKLLKRQLQYNRKYKKAFDRVIDQFASLVVDPNARFTKSFRFARPVSDKINGFITEFHDSVLTLTEAEITDVWGLSNEKNDLIVKDYLRAYTAIKAAQKEAYFMPNLDALKSFIGRSRNAEKLSDKVWKVARQLRGELEIHLGLGISNGDSAQVISRRIRQYLNNPDALFRRVRDAKGRLVASEAMIKFRKEQGLGQGVYTSAYKNAMRVARSETNAAYHTADYMRWNQLDMVKGIRISLSAQHPKYKYPEICEILQGDYPKTFVWTGWHPHCLCHATPILSSEEDFMAYLKGAPKDRNKMIVIYPPNFVTYVRGHYERFMKYSSVPYWLKDNQEVIEGFLK